MASKPRTDRSGAYLCPLLAVSNGSCPSPRTSLILDMLRRRNFTDVHDHDFHLQVLTASLVSSGP
jgi:hypothetical protein